MEVVQRLPDALRVCDALVLVSGGVWVYPKGDVFRFVFRLACPRDIVEDLVSSSNPSGGITNSDLGLLALVLQESCFLDV